MGYTFEIDNYYQVKKDGEYPWPCATEKDRKIELFTDDVLTKGDDGLFTVHTGICCFGIVLKKEEVKFVKEKSKLQMK